MRTKRSTFLFVSDFDAEEFKLFLREPKIPYQQFLAVITVDSYFL